MNATRNSVAGLADPAAQLISSHHHVRGIKPDRFVL